MNIERLTTFWRNTQWTVLFLLVCALGLFLMFSAIKNELHTEEERIGAEDTVSFLMWVVTVLFLALVGSALTLGTVENIGRYESARITTAGENWMGLAWNAVLISVLGYFSFPTLATGFSCALLIPIMMNFIIWVQEKRHNLRASPLQE